ncbi:MAG: prephenate dehydrogenase [Cyclobacteriaceae bacterium]
MKISIIGVGLIGGSFALALKRRLEDIEVFGWDASSKNLSKAKELGLIDHICDTVEAAVESSDWILVAVPVQHIESLIPQLLDYAGAEKVIVDFGSTKGQICQQVRQHKKRKQFIAAHPIAGTEYSGPQAAFDTLFEDKVMIVCEQELSESTSVEEFRKMCKLIGMKTVYLPADEHDMHLAYVSHLSHVIAFGLSNTVLEKEKTASTILELAGSGFDSTVRLAKSSPDMWTPIFKKNKKFILEGLDTYIAYLNTFRKHLDDGNEEAINAYLSKGREIRKILK